MSSLRSPETGFCGSKINAMSVKDGVIQNECFVDVLNIIPHALLALTSMFILTVWNHSVIGKLKVKTWVHFQGHSLRWICTLALMTTIIVEIAEGLISDLNDPDSTNYHAFVPACMAFLGGMLSIIFYHNVEQWNSPKFLLLLLMYWPMSVVLKCLKALSIYRNNLTLDHLKVWLALVDIIFYFLLFLVELNVLRCQRYSFFKKRRRIKPPVDLENTHYLQSYVCFISQAVYWWVTDLLIKGFRHPLTLKDLEKLPQSERSIRMYRKLQMIFNEEKFKAAQRNQQPSLLYSLFRATWPMLLLSALLRLVGDCLAFVGPVIVEHIVNYAYEVKNEMLFSASGNNTKPQKVYLFVTVDQFFWNGYVLSVVLFLALILQHTLLQNHHFIVIREGIRVRTAIQTMVYSKSLKISTLELNDNISAVGQIMNHMSIDSTFLMFFFFFVHYIWAVPVQVGLALLIMYLKLGLAGLVGGLFMVCAGPAMYLLGVAMSKMQKKNMNCSDKRAKKVNELIQGIEVIKLLSWETGFLKSIQEVRSAELSYLWPNTMIKALMSFVGISAPVIGSLLTFALYPLFEETPLPAGATMAVLALFNLLQSPLQIMSLLSTSVAHARVSSQRLLPFLVASEVSQTTGSSSNLTKSCSGGLDSLAPSCHNMVEKLESVTSVEGKNPPHPVVFELQTIEKEKSRRSSVSSYTSNKFLTPQHCRTHSRQENDRGGSFTGLTLSSSGGSVESTFLEPKRKDLSRNATSSELLDVKPHTSLVRKSSAPALAVSEITGDYKRRRHHSQWSMEEDAVLEDPVLEQHYTIDVQGGNFSWDLTREAITLMDISVKIPSGKLTVVVGQAGSGKSSLLSAFLGEMIQVSGNMVKTRHQGIAYVSQSPWIINASLKDNILFGKPFVAKKYRNVVAACGLQPDVEHLPVGDSTEIGEKGFSLNDGQKQRVCIARALYSDAETVLLDDPLSAMDSHVGKQVAEEVLVKRMVKRNRTVVFVTHQVQYLCHAHQVVVMANGHVHFQGKVGEMKKFDPDIYEVWRRAIWDAKSAEANQKNEASNLLNLERKHSRSSQSSHDTLSRSASSQSQSQLCVLGVPMGLQGVRKISAMSVMSEASNEDAVEDSMLGDVTDEPKTTSVPEQIPEEKKKLIKQETRETGAVKMSVYLLYLQACSVIMCLISLILQIVYHSLIVSSNFWLAVWVTDSNNFARNTFRYSRDTGNSTLGQEFNNTAYLLTFVYLSLGAVLTCFVGCLIIYQTGYVGSKNLFMNMLVTVIHFPLRFLDTGPAGRIMNRFSADTIAIDQRLGGHMENLLRCALFTLSAVVVNAVTAPYFLIAAVPFFIFYYFLQRFFRTTARELQRLDSITKSPVFSHLSETLNGLTVIRAYGIQTDFKRRAFKAIDCNVTPFLFIHTSNRWLGIRLDFMSCLLVFISSVTSLSSGLHGLANPAFIGLCITYTLMVSSQLNWIVRISTEVELSMNAVERVLDFADVSGEQSVTSNDGPVGVPESWPGDGMIEFNCVSLRYASNLDPVLHNMSFVIQGGEKIGICGKTGSGKTSIMLALFRMLEISEGSVLISGLDITRVDLCTLRSRLAVIPQVPILFSGTVRFNLDTKNKRSDEKLWSALEAVHLKEAVMALQSQLDAEIADGKEVLSAGQKQLLCIARALICDSKILVMDEVPATVDKETKILIQTIINSKVLENKTVISISNKPSEIMNCDRIMVLQDGELKEFAPPSDLLADETSIFYFLVHSESDLGTKG